MLVSCIAVSVYLGIANVTLNIIPYPITFAAWVSILPKIVTFFIKGIQDLLIVGIIIVLFGRSVRLYLERDAKLLRNIALIVTVAWFSEEFGGNSKRDLRHLQFRRRAHCRVKFQDFSMFIFSIVVGVLIGVASVLLIFIVSRSNREFFKKPDKNDSSELISPVD